jgi:uncharacterized protein (UPF0548 family)
VIDHVTGFKADIYLACDELHAWGMQRRRTILVDDLEVAVAPVEYVILRKLAYYREGRSGKHVRDIGHLRRRRRSVGAGLVDRSPRATRGLGRGRGGRPLMPPGRSLDPLWGQLKEALTRYVELERKRHELTREALDDVDAGRMVEHAEVEAWAARVAGPARKSRR